MATALQQAIQAAITSQGDTSLANKAYLEFLKANFIIPIEKSSSQSEEEKLSVHKTHEDASTSLLSGLTNSDSPEVLYLSYNSQTFLPVFSDMAYLDNWAHEVREQIHVLKLSGVDLLKGIGENVYISLDIGSPHYKEFNPDEIARMRSMVIKLFKE